MDATGDVRLALWDGYEQVSYWRVSCSAGCGAYLAGGTDGWFSTPERRYAARFPDQDRAWQGAVSAQWANTPLPGHDAHEHGPYGDGGVMFFCDQRGAGDCQEVRDYRSAIVCSTCRAAGWFPW